MSLPLSASTALTRPARLAADPLPGSLCPIRFAADLLPRFLCLV